MVNTILYIYHGVVAFDVVFDLACDADVDLADEVSYFCRFVPICPWLPQHPLFATACSQGHLRHHTRVI